MKIFDLKDSEGRIYAFEVSNSLLSRRGACRIVGRVPGARIVRQPRRFQLFGPAEFCEFELDGVRFVLWEPFGGNGRFWIGPEPPRWVPQIEAVRVAFAGALRWVLI